MWLKSICPVSSSQLVHRKIGDPAELEDALLGEAELAPDLEPRIACERHKADWRAAHEKDSIAVIDPQLDAQIGGQRRAKVSGNRAGSLPVPENYVPKSRLALGLSPGIHPIAKGPAPPRWRRDRPDADLSGISFNKVGEHRKPGTAELRGDVAHDDRIPQIGLIAAVSLDSVSIGDLRKRQRGHRPAAAKFLEYAMQHRSDRREYVLLGDKRHLEIELIMLPRRPVGAARLVAEARGDLKIAIEPGRHDQLFELLRRLRQSIKLTGVQPARNEIVPRSFG